MTSVQTTRKESPVPAFLTSLTQQPPHDWGREGRKDSTGRGKENGAGRGDKGREDMEGRTGQEGQGIDNRTWTLGQGDQVREDIAGRTGLHKIIFIR